MPFGQGSKPTEGRLKPVFDNNIYFVEIAERKGMPKELERRRKKVGNIKWHKKDIATIHIIYILCHQIWSMALKLSCRGNDEYYLEMKEIPKIGDFIFVSLFHPKMIQEQPWCLIGKLTQIMSMSVFTIEIANGGIINWENAECYKVPKEIVEPYEKFVEVFKNGMD